MKQGRTETGKTKKYSGVASTVKKAAEKKVIQDPLPRLSYDRIKMIYDEYGFATPNVKHVQEKLPNDEAAMRKILQSHRKVMDEEVKAKTGKKIADMQYHTEVYKQNQKNHLAMMKQQAKMAKQSGLPPHMAGGATGGPGMQIPMQQPQMQMPQEQPMQQNPSVGGEESLPPGMAPNQQPLDISNGGDAFFVGDFALVKLVNPGVQSDKSPIWLIDVKNKVLRPFMSSRAFDSYFGASQDAYDAIVVLPSSAVSEGGPLGEFKMMNSEFGIKEDGKMRKLDHSPAMIQRRYGKPVDEAAENKSVLAIDGMFKKLKNGGTSQAGMHEMPNGEMMADEEMGGPTGGPGYGYDGVGGPGIPTLSVTRNLEPGMSGDDVKSLQEWLKAQGYLNIANTTTYYGDLTKAAVAKWQSDNGIDAGKYPGYFGPRSLKKARAAGAEQGVQSEPAVTQPNTTGTSGTSGSSTPQWSGDEDYKKSGDTAGTMYSAQSDGNDYSTAKNSFTKSFSNTLEHAGNLTNISSSMIESVKQDPSLLAFYINALTYGGYSLNEVFKDMKRRELINSGKAEFEDKLVISGEKTREEWANTDEGRLANTLPEFNAMKLNIGNVDPSIFNLPLYDVPGELFRQLIPILDPSTPEYKAEIEKIQTIMHDTQVAIINAQTEQGKAAAENEYEKFKEAINKTYGITLSNNSIEAWKQIESLGTSAAQSGIYGSGIHNEAVDDSLASRRLTGERARDEKLTKEEERMSLHYSKYASPSEIKKLIDEDIAKGIPRDKWRATKWGLVPSQDVINSMDFAALKQKFPGLSDEEIKNKRDNILDEFGNYRSQLYQNKATAMENERVSHKADQETLYTERNKLEEEKKARELTAASDPFTSPKKSSGTPVTTNTSTNQQTPTPTTAPQTNSQQTQQTPPAGTINSAVTNIQNSLSGVNTTPTKTTTTPPAQPSSPPKTYNSLYDYYSANGGWNTWNSAKRQEDAKGAGISGYTGTAEQNTTLLKKLRGY